MKIKWLMTFGFLVLAVLTFLIIQEDSLQKAGLHWETLHQRFDLPAGAATHSAAFHFKNTSNQPITILTIKPDCNCLVSKIAQSTIAPGASGQIDIIFNPGDRSGIQKRSIEVRTKEFPGQVANLKLTYYIPELIRVSHRLLFWTRQGDPTSQEIELTMPDQDIKVTGVRSTNSDFTCEVITVAEGRDYKVKVTPVDVTTARQSLLLIDTDYPKAPWNRLVANVKIL